MSVCRSPLMSDTSDPAGTGDQVVETHLMWMLGTELRSSAKSGPYSQQLSHLSRPFSPPLDVWTQTSLCKSPTTGQYLPPCP